MSLVEVKKQSFRSNNMIFRLTSKWENGGIISNYAVSQSKFCLYNINIDRWIESTMMKAMIKSSLSGFFKNFKMMKIKKYKRLLIKSFLSLSKIKIMLAFDFSFLSHGSRISEIIAENTIKIRAFFAVYRMCAKFSKFLETRIVLSSYMCCITIVAASSIFDQISSYSCQNAWNVCENSTKILMSERRNLHNTL